MLARMSAVVVLAGLVGVGLARPGVPSPEPTVSQFLLAWESQHYLQAAELTTGPPKTVAAALAGAYERLDASNLTCRFAASASRARPRARSSTPPSTSGAPAWSGPTLGNFALRDGNGGWQVVWSPSVIVPGMTEQGAAGRIQQLLASDRSCWTPLASP